MFVNELINNLWELLMLYVMYMIKPIQLTDLNIKNQTFYYIDYFSKCWEDNSGESSSFISSVLGKDSGVRCRES